MVGPRDRTGQHHPGAATGDRRHRRAVVRRDERWRAVELDDLADLPGERADGVGLEGLLAAERRQHGDQPLGQHRLADPRRPGHEQVVPTRGGQLEGEPRLGLADDVGEVGPGPGRHVTHRRWGRGRQRRAVLGRGVPVDDVAQALGAVHRDPVDELGLADVLDRHDDVAAPPPARPPAPRAAPRARRAPARRAPARRGGRRRGRAHRGSRPAAESTATAMGRSKHAPRLGIEAGERLTVTRCGGTGTPLFAAADRTRSGACAHAASGMPPIAKCGSPCAMCASTSTTVPSSPDRATDRVRPRPWLTTRPPRRAARRPAGRAGTGCRRRRRAPARPATARRARARYAAASRRSRIALAKVTASTGSPNPEERRVLTSQMTRQSPSRATMSTSPCSHRQLRSSTSMPARAGSARPAPRRSGPAPRPGAAGAPRPGALGPQRCSRRGARVGRCWS